MAGSLTAAPMPSSASAVRCTGSSSRAHEAGPVRSLVRPRASGTVEEVLDGRSLAAVSTITAAAGRARGHRGAGAPPRGGPITGMFASLPPSPELLAQVGALPPTKDVPDVDLRKARAGDQQFTLRRLLRPLTLALIAGLILDGLDADRKSV